MLSPRIAPRIADDYPVACQRDNLTEGCTGLVTRDGPQGRGSKLRRCRRCVSRMASVRAWARHVVKTARPSDTRRWCQPLVREGAGSTPHSCRPRFPQTAKRNIVASRLWRRGRDGSVKWGKAAQHAQLRNGTISATLHPNATWCSVGYVYLPSVFRNDRSTHLSLCLEMTQQ